MEASLKQFSDHTKVMMEVVQKEAPGVVMPEMPAVEEMLNAAEEDIEAVKPRMVRLSER